MKCISPLAQLSLFTLLCAALACTQPQNIDQSHDDDWPGQSDTLNGNRERPPSDEELSFDELVAQYENKDRVYWQKPDMIISRLGNLSEKVVADIGAGSGYFARRIAYKARKVIALDIDPQFIEFMDSLKQTELPAEIRDRFETRLASPNNPNLQPGEVDLVLIVNTYIYLPNRIAYLEELRSSLKPGGRIVIIDFKKKRIPMTTPPASIRVPLFQVEEEVEKAGYTLVFSDDTSLDYQYILMAKVP
jgi:SAM-dependent methyltransferase